MTTRRITLDGNEAAASVAYRTNEVCAIYPITPASAMGEFADEWAAKGLRNIWGNVPHVIEMQSEAGAAGAVHGALQTGALSTTFTASQGLLLMIPNMFKIAGELTPTVFHIAARSVAAHALSIFGDHSDVMAARATGWAMLASGSVQEAHDLALVAQAATLRARVPFLHFFDGFRTSHEVQKIAYLSDDDLRAMIDDDLVFAHRARSLSPERPVLRGSAQNPDVFFQSREAANPFYAACAGIVAAEMERFERVTGRRYRLFEYVGHPEADRVLVVMGSGAEVAHETVEWLNGEGARVGVLKVRLFRPFDGAALAAALPPTARAVGVLDRTKEPGAAGEPLYQDVVTALAEADRLDGVRVVGGRYGLSSKEFTPAMVKAVLENLSAARPKNRFTVGIRDDVSGTSLDFDPSTVTPAPGITRAVFYGLGSDGTVGAAKNTVKIVGEETENDAQGYFVYDSKKAGSITVSHLRFGKGPIRSSYLVRRAEFVGVHHPVFLDRYDVLAHAREGATVLLNHPAAPDRVFDALPLEAQRHVIEKRLKVFTIDAFDVARRARMGRRINTIMQTCFFALCGFLPRDEAIGKIKDSIRKTYGKKGEAIVQMNFEAVEMTLANLHEVPVPAAPTATRRLTPPVSGDVPAFVRDVTAEIIAGRGDDLPVSAFPVDGTYPVGTARFEKRNIALEVPVWDPALCIQCNKCAIVCPHATIRAKVYPKALLDGAPEGWRWAPVKGKEVDLPGDDHVYTLQVAPEDCTGCGICVEVCPARAKEEAKRKAIVLTPHAQVRDREAAYWEWFLSLPEVDRTRVKMSVKGSQFLRPLFEFSGACEGCGETPYLKLLSQLYGDRAIVANATGCSSIYGGNLPTTPWAANADGRGPAWSNSLFEDNAEFGLGFRITLDQHRATAAGLLKTLEAEVGADLAADLLAHAFDRDEAGIGAQRARVETLRKRLEGVRRPEAAHLRTLADALVHRSVWIVGGDGWAYDIGYGGLDHVLSTGRDVNILVLDTEVYSNTGGQASKATPLGAVAKFASAGKPAPKKDLAWMAMAYGNVYVARVALGADDAQTLKAFLEADSFRGPSIVIAYAHCIAHGIEMRTGMTAQRLAVESGAWTLLRYDPRRAAEGRNPLVIDSKPPKIPLEAYAYQETRYKMLAKARPEEARRLLEAAQEEVRKRRRLYEQMAAPPTAPASGA